MRLRSFIILLTSTLIVVLCAFLPEIISWRQDAKYLDQVQFASVSDIRLEFTDTERTLKETIGILGEIRESQDIPVELASLKQDNVQRIAGKTIEAYRDAGLVAESASFVMQGINPMLVYGTGENRNNVFWHVSFYDYKLGLYVNFTIDDRTGTVVSVDFGHTNADEYTQQDMAYILGNFVETYLDALGEEFREYDPEELLDQAKAPYDESYLANSIYYFVDGYRECSITFFVNQNGFYTYIS